MWAFYQAKIIYNLGYPKSDSAFIALRYLTEIVKKDIDSKTNCFRMAGLLVQDIHYTDIISSPIIKFSGEFYTKGSFYRNLQTHFPIKPVTPEYERKMVYSGVAFLQYCINIIKGDKEALDILTKIIRNILELYETGMGFGVSSIYFIPQTSYFEATGEWPEGK